MIVTRPIPSLDLKQLCNFWAKIDYTDHDGKGCHWWIGAINSNYKYKSGIIKINGHKFFASRVAYFIHYKQQPKFLICHTCDNSLCVNPEHLFDGTQSENMQDMWNKNRHIPPQPLFNEFCQNRIIDEYQSGDTTYAQLASKYNTSNITIQNIIYQNKAYAK